MSEMNFRVISILFLLGIAIFFLSSCKKFLAQKPSKDVLVPYRLSDLQAILDNSAIMNYSENLGESIADNYYLLHTDFASPFLSSMDRSRYIWENDDLDISLQRAWQTNYTQVLWSNIVLEQLSFVVDSSNKAMFNDVKGQALFFRSFAFYQLAQDFCRPYLNSSSTDLGIALRLVSNTDIPSVRATVKETYDRIVQDLKEATDLLPENTISKTRPCKAAAFGLLARVYLTMQDYAAAANYSMLCLQRYNTLLDFNNLNPNSSNPIPKLHAETIFWAQGYSTSLIHQDYSKIDSALYNSYVTTDLRRSIYFKKNPDNISYWFKGSYAGDYNWQLFFGIATDEIYLIRSECFARSGNKDSALHYLNSLLQKRWKTGMFTPVSAVNSADALGKILIERRKELIFRGLRLSDIRRFNLEGANIVITRKLNGVTYTLPPNDPRWVSLIPNVVINLSGMQQNPR